MFDELRIRLKKEKFDSALARVRALGGRYDVQTQTWLLPEYSVRVQDLERYGFELVNADGSSRQLKKGS